jgi:predicted MFS family arabinose efflux permease
MVTLGLAETRLVAVSGGILYGIAIGLNRPTIFAWTTDLARPGHVALSLATMLLALEIGIGAGAFVTGGLFRLDDAAATISFGFFLAAGSGVMGLLYLIWYASKQERKKRRA